MIDARQVRLPDVRLDESYKFSKAARLAGVSPKTFIRWRVDGVKLPTGERIRLRAFRAGRKWCVTGAELIEFLTLMQTPAVQLDAPRRAGSAGGRDFAAAAEQLGL